MYLIKQQLEKNIKESEKQVENYESKSNSEFKKSLYDIMVDRNLKKNLEKPINYSDEAYKESLNNKAEFIIEKKKEKIETKAANEQRKTDKKQAKKNFKHHNENLRSYYKDNTREDDGQSM